MDVAHTRDTSRGAVNIAYRVIGDREIDPVVTSRQRAGVAMTPAGPAAEPTSGRSHLGHRSWVW